MKYKLLSLITIFIAFNASSQSERPIKDPNFKKNAGVHVIAEFWGAKVINDEKRLENILLNTVKEANCTPIGTLTKKFEPQGVTVLVLLTESHATIHTWPELDYIAIDFFACGDTAKPLQGIEYLTKQLKPQKTQIKIIPRGERLPKPTKVTTTDDQLFGQELTIDLKQCDHETICSKEKIQEYINQLCILIDMKKYGKPFIEHFATHSEIAAGYSFAQMIETSLISGHLSEAMNNAYINIFSCKEFSVEMAVEFTKTFFGAQDLSYSNNQR